MSHNRSGYWFPLKTPPTHIFSWKDSHHWTDSNGEYYSFCLVHSQFHPILRANREEAFISNFFVHSNTQYVKRIVDIGSSSFSTKTKEESNFSMDCNTVICTTKHTYTDYRIYESIDINILVCICILNINLHCQIRCNLKKITRAEKHQQQVKI